MEKYIYDRKPLSLVKNKEFSFNIPVSIDTKQAEFILECPEFGSSNFELKVTFFIGKNNSKFSKEVILKSGYNTFGFSDLKPEEQGKYILLSCIGNENLNLALSIKEPAIA